MGATIEELFKALGDLEEDGPLQATSLRLPKLSTRPLCQDTIGVDYHRWEETGGTYAAPDADLAATVTYEKLHALSEVVTAVLEAGLVLEMLHEQTFTNAPWPSAVRGADGYYRLPESWPRFPLTYSLRARLPA